MLYLFVRCVCVWICRRYANIMLGMFKRGLGYSSAVRLASTACIAAEVHGPAVLPSIIGLIIACVESIGNITFAKEASFLDVEGPEHDLCVAMSTSPLCVVTCWQYRFVPCKSQARARWAAERWLLDDGGWLVRCPAGAGHAHTETE